MRNIIVKATEVARAIEKAKKVDSRDWQAECIEILLIPKVYKRWQKLNTRFPKVEITRIKGIPFTREVNPGEIEDWSAFAGYVFGYGAKGYSWNSVRETHYGHSASTTWDGIRRETVHGFLQDLHNLYLSLVDERVKARVGYLESNLYQYNIIFYNDLDGPVVEGYHGFEEFYTAAEAQYKRAWVLAKLGNRVKRSSIEKIRLSGMWRITIEATKKPDLQYVSRKMIAA